jgi:hypothetical protein
MRGFHARRLHSHVRVAVGQAEAARAAMAGPPRRQEGFMGPRQRRLQRERLWCACIQGGGSVCARWSVLCRSQDMEWQATTPVEAKDKALCLISLLYPIARRPPCVASAPIQHTRLQPHRSTEARLEHRTQRKARRTPANQNCLPQNRTPSSTPSFDLSLALPPLQISWAAVFDTSPKAAKAALLGGPCATLAEKHTPALLLSFRLVDFPTQPPPLHRTDTQTRTHTRERCPSICPNDGAGWIEGSSGRRAPLVA